MLIKNARVYRKDYTFAGADVRIENGTITEIGNNLTDEEIYDAQGAYLVPGFINIHVHGAIGYDVMDVTEEQLAEVSRFFLQDGVTSYLPTTVTDAYDKTISVVKCIADYMEKQTSDAAEVLGVNVEGPYLNVNFKGAHPPQYLVGFDAFSMDGVLEAAKGQVRLITIAPEVEGAAEFIKKYKDSVNVSLGHGGDDYEKCKEAFAAGATQVTHLFNTMPSIHHRNKGLIHAAFEVGVRAELICDDVHVDRSVVLMAIRMFGTDKICVITDGVHATGQPDGRYYFASAGYTVVNGVAKNDEGNLVGGTSTMLQCVQNLVAWGISLEDAIRMATANPADAIGVSDRKGRIDVGMDADLVLLDSKLNLKKVWKK